MDERSKRTGTYIESVGTYNPLTEPKDVKLNQDRIDDWIKKGAQPSAGYLRMIGKAPQRLPRKPKKQQKEGAPAAQTPAPAAEGENTPVAEETTSQTAETTQAQTPNATEPTPSPETPTDETNQTETKPSEGEVAVDAANKTAATNADNPESVQKES